MNRRDFLNWLGLGSAALLIDPFSLVASNPEVQVCKDYPKLHFTGMKGLCDVYAGQFLWTVDYIDESNVADRVYWFCNATVDLDVLDQSTDKLAMIRARLENGVFTVSRMMDGIVEEALKGRVQLAKWEQIPNPNFNPSLPETTEYDEEYEVWNPRTISGEQITKKIKSMKFGSYGENVKDGWNIDRIAQETLDFYEKRNGRRPEWQLPPGVPPHVKSMVAYAQKEMA